MAHIQYLTMNSIAEGVGASQVGEYVRRLSQHGHAVSLLSFEKSVAPDLEVPGVEWTPRLFGPGGPLGAARRLSVCITAARRAPGAIVHARSDLPALAAILARSGKWVWDMRAFWRDQRVAMGVLSATSPTARLMEQVERRAAAESSAIICLAEAAVPVLQKRFGDDVARKTTVIPTAVDTVRFQPAPRSMDRRINILLSGSYNAFYDGATTVKFIETLSAMAATRVAWVGAGDRSPWRPNVEPWVDQFVAPVALARVAELINENDVGLVICHQNVGVSLRGAMPTKIAEFLACGRPVVVSSGLGDMDRLIRDYRCGTVIRGDSTADVALAAIELRTLLDDPDLTERCRACAIDWFDLDKNVTRLSMLYERLDVF